MLLTSEKSGITKAETSKASDSIVTLRQILARQEQREVGYDEAQEVGHSLIEFYKILATEMCDEPA